MDFSLEHHKDYIGRPIAELPTPSLIVSLPIVKKNIAALHKDVEDLGIDFRPHVKTLKTLEITRMMLGNGKYRSVVASTLAEIRGLLPLVKEGQLDELDALRQSLRITLMVDNEQQIDVLEAYSASKPWDIFVKLDVGSHRAGVATESPALRSLVERAEKSIAANIYGFYCHAGHSYGGRSREAAEETLNVEITSVLHAASLLSESRDLVVSIGATPTAHVVSAFKHKVPSNIKLELHAGNFPCNDLQQVSTNLVCESDQAIRVATEVCGVYPERNEALVNAGAIALSRETSDYSGYGRVVGKPDWSPIRLSQEHGILGTTEGEAKVIDNFKPTANHITFRAGEPSHETPYLTKVENKEWRWKVGSLVYNDPCTIETRLIIFSELKFIPAVPITMRNLGLTYDEIYRHLLPPNRHCQNLDQEQSEIGPTNLSVVQTGTKKCDEIKPMCTGCSRNQLTCRWPVEIHTRRDSDKSVQGNRTLMDSAEQSSSQATNISFSGSPNNREGSLNKDVPVQSHTPEEVSLHDSVDVCNVQAETPTRQPHQTRLESVEPDSNEPLEFLPSQLGIDVQADSESGSHSGPEALPSDTILGSPLPESHYGHLRALELMPMLEMHSIPSSPSCFPGLQTRSFQLLSYYTSRTALSMGNGSTTDNPFITQMVPLMFVNKLILQLVLTQTATHQAIARGDTLEAVRQDYASALRYFQSAIEDYLSGCEGSLLWVTLGALIMCFTETARGDVHGAIFDHLSASGPLVAQLIIHTDNHIPRAMKNFITEYYVYTGLISMISIDATVCTKPLLDPGVVAEAQRLATSGYVGQLCGTWLPLLLLIPEIASFAGRALSKTVNPSFPQFDDFATYSSLESQILAFCPTTVVDQDVVICSLIYQQAVHLYLLTCLKGYQQDDGAMLYSQQTENSLTQAFTLLRQLGPMARINTSLCWAIAVIGCCITDQEQRAELCGRLTTMFKSIGLGNIRATKKLLNLVWKQPVTEQSPWFIHKAMQENQMWISFA
ncbi:hypothetical protein PFICI_10804 [Pestalotiopsis fici W106-1]|uniref:D-serine dehydratase n=1 Tax=Pestalotiopsis fici (strain W106-1 / CGMCC3.15140) TaxID=1229662 RepID=W3WSU4_PESFW|nr:uncharacterized protein PFICI_10804 [Pestalotiopsis fici W106-1]ETS76930.1 hypothetical protein PFICI_10804 [Pestalotiopsis fici W106-1]